MQLSAKETIIQYLSNNIDSLKTIRIQCIEIRFIQGKSIQEK